MQKLSADAGFGPAADQPSAWIEHFSPLVPTGGRVLDLACGSGRHARSFLKKGHPLTALDRDVSGLQDLNDNPWIEILQSDLEAGEPWPLGERTFACIVVVNYLYRPLFPAIARALSPSGVLLYETFSLGHEKFGRPRNPDYLLRPGELLSAFGERLSVLAFEQGRIERSSGPAVKQFLCAINGPVEDALLPALP